MLKKGAFFDFLNRKDGTDYEKFIADSIEDEHYINWNEFALPHDYGDAEYEYTAIRTSCAIFDVSPIRKIRIRGSEAGAFLDRLCTRPVSALPALRATYTVFCNENGSLKDDAILYKLSDDDYLLMPSDIDHSPYFESLRETLNLKDVSFTECTDAWNGLAIQGPQSAMVVASMGFDGVEQIAPFEVRQYPLAGKALFISRLGFTADLGYECWFEPELADSLAQSITAARSSLNIAIPGYGLTALQACRLEGGFIVAGWDFATETEPNPGFERTPYEVSLGWLVNLDAAAFVGRDALLAQKRDGQRYFQRSFTIDDACQPDDGAMLFSSAEQQDSAIGIITCSSWSWGMNKTIGNASMHAAQADIDTAWLEIEGKPLKLALSKGPLLNLERRNQVPASTSMSG